MDNSRITKDYDVYRMFFKSEAIKLSDEGDFGNIDRKNFEILKQTIALRSTPEQILPLKYTRSVKEYGSTKFVGLGYIWEFAIEAVDIFFDKGDPVGILVKELDGIVLPCGGVLRTVGDGCNIEFIKWQHEEATET